MGLGERIAAKRVKERKVIEVKEWGEDDAPLLMYISSLTCSDLDKLQRKHKDFITNPTISGMVDMIILKAEDKEGEKLFTLEDKPFLMREELNTVSKIAGEMFSTVISVGEQGNG